MSIDVADFELPNVSTGPEQYRLSERAADTDLRAVVLLFQRDYHCGKCRKQVQAVADRYDEFTDRQVEVVSVLPEPASQTAKWHESYDLPYPLLADESKQVSDDFDQPTRFGALGSLHDLVGRMPEAVVLDVRSGDPNVHHVHKGSGPSDRPSIDDLLDIIDDLDSAS